MKSILKTFGIGLLTTAFSVGLMAQNQPEITVVTNLDGSVTYTVNPGQANEQIITIGTDGSASIGGSAITIPTMPDFTPDATINPDGDLVLADGTVIPRPDLDGGPSIEDRFAGTMVPNGGSPTTDGWWFSYNFKDVYFFGESAPNFVFIQRLGSYFYIHPEGTIDQDGIFAFGFDFPVNGQDTWVFLQSVEGLLVDLRVLPGTSNSQKRIGGDNPVSFFWVFDAQPSGFYAFLENSGLTEGFVQFAEGGDFIKVWPR